MPSFSSSMRSSAMPAPTSTVRRASARPAPTSSRTSSMRPSIHHAASRLTGVDRSGAASPAMSMISTATSSAGAKRKERDFEAGAAIGLGEATNINVVVRCRGRNEREVRENSAVVVGTDGTKGKTVELLMGPNSLSNKSYAFDRVFSQAADQGMVFDEVVRPILNEMLAGFNCTIFAYGQTGTGKTYTMSGDMTETLGILSENAGIIPRVLQALFAKLEGDQTEHCVRCSFIELYNEELRDLLTPDENAKLKIFDDNTKKGHSTVMVQGMEERHIRNAAEGIKRLHEGSDRRQVAATQCNDFSSRSHTVFTITVYAKRPSEDGEDLVSLGKLNLVDLAGSESIGRSGAENKRATEAGLINKSLLTLGRVINALVDRGQHIPYRESKLTRLLQDSLGGRTKTCIIATLSPARDNLEETMSTLDYAFRAKNIRNKPQLNALMNKKALLSEFTAEIEKLKSELIATRLRNGVHLTCEAYEEMTLQSESRRILAEEQTAKIETVENNLRNKVSELLSLTQSFVGLKHENEGTKMELDEAKDVIDQTEVALATTRQALADETRLREAHQATEEQLHAVGQELMTSIDKASKDVDGLHAKLERKANLDTLNHDTWGRARNQVHNVTGTVEVALQKLQQNQQSLIDTMHKRLAGYAEAENKQLKAARAAIDKDLFAFDASTGAVSDHASKSKEEVVQVLKEIGGVRENVKSRVAECLQSIAGVAEKIAGEVLSGLDSFQGQLQSSYTTLGSECKTAFDGLVLDLQNQRAESVSLRQQLEEASRALTQQSAKVADQVQKVVEEERQQAAKDREQLLTQISGLLTAQAGRQEARMAGKVLDIKQQAAAASNAFTTRLTAYSSEMDAWNKRAVQIESQAAKATNALKRKFEDDWQVAEQQSVTLRQATTSVHAETCEVVNAQIDDLDTQLEDLDNIIDRADGAIEAQHGMQVALLTASTEAGILLHKKAVEQYKDIEQRVTGHQTQLQDDMTAMQGLVDNVEQDARQPVIKLQRDMMATKLTAYVDTGKTPPRRKIAISARLPRTAAAEVVFAGAAENASPLKVVPVTSPEIYRDEGDETVDRTVRHSSIASQRPTSASFASPETTRGSTLREIPSNVSANFEPTASTQSISAAMDSSTTSSTREPARKRARKSLDMVDEEKVSMNLPRTVSAKGTGIAKLKSAMMLPALVAEGRENVPPAGGMLAQSVGRRRSRRLGG